MRKFFLAVVAAALLAGCSSGSGGIGGETAGQAFPTASAPTIVSPGPTSPSPSPTSVPSPNPTTPPTPQPGQFPLQSYFQALEALSPQAMATTRYVAFHTDKALLAADTNGVVDVYLQDLRFDRLCLVSRNPQGKSGNGASQNAAISADGRFVVFSSEATDLVPNDDEGQRDVFLFDVHSEGVIRLTPGANGSCDTPTVSGDGNLVAFVSRATNLAGSPSGANSQVYLLDRQGSVMTLVSDVGSGAADADCLTPVLSSNGEKLVFSTGAGNLGTLSNAFSQILAYDIATPSLQLLSTNSGGGPASGHCLGPDIDASGQAVVFFGAASDLSGGGLDWQVYRNDNGTVQMVSVAASQNPGNGDSGLCAISEDGTTVSFATLSTDLAGAGSQGADVILSDGSGFSLIGSGDTSALANDGSQLSFRTTDSLATLDTDSTADIYAYHREDARPKLLSAERTATNREFVSVRGFLCKSRMRNLKVSDFDLDGHDDIVGYLDARNYIEVYFGDGTGRFSSPLTVSVGNRPSGLSIGNIDNSGGTDLVVSNDDDDTVTAVFFQTNRSFTTSTINVGNGPEDVVLGHFNDDQNLDFAASCFFGFSFRYGDGSGGFGNPQDMVGFRSGGETAVGDFNEDNIDDIVGNDGFGVSFLLSNGPASFVQSARYAASSQVNIPIAVDIDKDQNLDVVTTAGIYYGDGTGDFTLDNASPITYNYNLVDANLDQFLDVVTSTNGSANLPDGLGLRLNDQSTNFNLVQEIDLTLGGQPVPGDFNEDGFPDLARQSGDYIAIVSGDGTGFLDTQRLFVNIGPAEVAVADLDGDNLLDVLTTRVSTLNIETAAVFPGLDTGDLDAPEFLDFQGNSLPLFDLNYDGLLDLVSEVMAALNQGGGAFAVPTSLGVGTQPRDAAVVQAGNDPFPDLAVGSYASDDITYLLGDGTQSFMTDSSISGFRITQVKGAYLDGDNLEDLAMGDFNGLHVILNNSMTGYGISQSFNLGGNLVYGVGAGDLDEDGFCDLVATTKTSGRVGSYTVFVNDGTGQFTQGTTIELTTEAGEVEVADLDLDGHLDVLIAGELDNSITILYGDGSGTFQRGLDLVTDRNVTPFGFSIGDVNGDLKPDVVTANGNESSVGVFLQR